MPPESSPPPVPTPPPAPPPAPLTGPPGVPPQDQAYSFITNPPEPPKESPFSFLGRTSAAGRVLLGVGVVVIFFIILLILRAMVSGGGNAESLISVAQDQQVLIHLTEKAGEEQSLSSKNRNLAATVQAAVSSSQTELLTYLANGGKRLKAKDLNLKVSAATDERLSAASSAGTYNKTFEDVMATELNRYGKDLQQAYQESKGPKARAMLTDSFEQAKLMGVQLNSPG